MLYVTNLKICRFFLVQIIWLLLTIHLSSEVKIAYLLTIQFTYCRKFIVATLFSPSVRPYVHTSRHCLKICHEVERKSTWNRRKTNHSALIAKLTSGHIGQCWFSQFSLSSVSSAWVQSVQHEFSQFSLSSVSSASVQSVQPRLVSSASVQSVQPEFSQFSLSSVSSASVQSVQPQFSQFSLSSVSPASVQSVQPQFSQFSLSFSQFSLSSVRSVSSVSSVEVSICSFQVCLKGWGQFRTVQVSLSSVG